MAAKIGEIETGSRIIIKSGLLFFKTRQYLKKEKRELPQITLNKEINFDKGN